MYGLATTLIVSFKWANPLLYWLPSYIYGGSLLLACVHKKQGETAVCDDQELIYETIYSTCCKNGNRQSQSKKQLHTKSYRSSA